MQHTEVMTEEKELTPATKSEEVKNNQTATEVVMNPLMDLNSYDALSNEELYKTAEKLVKTEPIQRIKKQIDQIKTLLFNSLAEERRAKLEAFVNDGNSEIDFEYIQPLKDQFKELLTAYKNKRDAYFEELTEKYRENLKLRQTLIEELKELVNTEETLSSTFEQFRNIQERWRNAGPISREESADVFRNYHHHVENFYDYVQINKELRDLDFQKNLDQKNELIAKAESLINESSINKAFKELQKLHKIWKEQTGPVVKELREETWNRFSEATKKIHDKRQEFIASQKLKQEENLKTKVALCEELEAVSTDGINSSKDWKKMDELLLSFMERWKKIGRAPDADNDAIWERFKEAQSSIRKAKNTYYKELKKGFSAALDQLTRLTEQAEELKDSTDWKETSNTLKGLQASWRNVKGAPKKESDQLWTRFRTACNHFFDAMQADFDKKEEALKDNAKAKAELLKKYEAQSLPKEPNAIVSLVKEWQEEWKNTGPVPRAEKELEDRFRAFASNIFDQMDMEKGAAEKLKIQAKIEQWVAEGNETAIRKEQDFIRHKIAEANAELLQLETNIQMFNTNGKKNPMVESVKKKIAEHKSSIELMKEKLKWIRTFSKPKS